MLFENDIYRAVLVSVKESADGENPTLLVLNEENSCLILWFDDPDTTEMVKFFPKYARNQAIEFAVTEGARRRKEIAEKGIQPL